MITCGVHRTPSTAAGEPSAANKLHPTYDELIAQVATLTQEIAEPAIERERVLRNKLNEWLIWPNASKAYFERIKKETSSLLYPLIAVQDAGPCMFRVSQTTCGYPENHEVHKRPYWKGGAPHHEFESARPPDALPSQPPPKPEGEAVECQSEEGVTEVWKERT